MALKLKMLDGTTSEFQTGEALADAAQAQIIAATAALETEKKAHDATKKKLEDAADPKTIAKRVKDRADLLEVARKMLGDAASKRLADSDDNEVKKEVIKKAGLTLPEGASQDFLDGLYNGAKALAADAEPEPEDPEAPDGEPEEEMTADKRVGDSRGFASNKNKASKTRAADGSDELLEAQNRKPEPYKFAFSK